MSMNIHKVSSERSERQKEHSLKFLGNKKRLRKKALLWLVLPTLSIAVVLVSFAIVNTVLGVPSPTSTSAWHPPLDSLQMLILKIVNYLLTLFGLISVIALFVGLIVSVRYFLLSRRVEDVRHNGKSCSCSGAVVQNEASSIGREKNGGFANRLMLSLFSPSGRIGRLSFFLYYMFSLLIFAVLAALFEDSSDFFLVIPFVWSYVLIVLSIKRMHDLNHPGWHLLSLFVPILNMVVFIGLLFVPGTLGGNNYGIQEKNLVRANRSSRFARFLNATTFKFTLAIVIIFALCLVGHFSSLDDEIIAKSNELIDTFNKGGGDVASQMENLAESASSTKNKVEMYKNAGYTYSSGMDETKAKDSFKKALELVDESSFDYYLISAEIAVLENKARVALYNYEKAYEMNPNDFQVNNGLGLFYLGITDASEQFTDYNKSLVYFKNIYKPSSTNNILKENMAMAYYFLEDFDSALPLFLEVSESSIDKNLDYWIGLCYLGKEDLVNAKLYLMNAYKGGVDMEQVFIDFINSDM